MALDRRYDALWDRIGRCRECRDDDRIEEATREHWESVAFMPFPSKGPEPAGGVVRYVFIAQEPSASWTRGKSRLELAERMDKDPHLRNFNGSLWDFILRWSARKWLLRPGEAFYLTDLGKCAVIGAQVQLTRGRRYTNCSPFLSQEIALYGHTLRAIIPLGGETAMWTLAQAKPEWPPILPAVTHYGARFLTRVKALRDRSYRPDVDDINRFIQRTKPGSKKVMSRKNKRAVLLAQLYKHRFGEIRRRYSAQS